MSIPCFFIEPTGKQKVFLRRYVGSDKAKCPGKYSYHNGMMLIGEATVKKSPEGYIESIPVSAYQDDPRWPAKCDHCDYVFGPLDEFQVFTKQIYRRKDNGQEMILDEAPAGAIWNAWWRADFESGPDGQCLCVRMPGDHEWCIDGRASNCDSPCVNCGRPYHSCTAINAAKVASPNEVRCKGYKDSHPHKCWVRRGIPPNLTVGKGAPGESCHAGAGSIVVPGWHGFLRNGKLEAC